MQWLLIILVGLSLPFFIANIEIPITANKEETTLKNKIMNWVKFILISIVELGILLGMLGIFYKMPYIRIISRAIDGIINEVLKLIPLGFFVIWIIIPLVAMYFIYVIKGMKYYLYKKNDIRAWEKEQEEKSAKAIPVSVEGINKIVDYRKFLKNAQSNKTFSVLHYKDHELIYCNDQKQLKSLREYRNLSGDKFPIVFVLHNGETQAVSPNESVGIVRTLLKGGAA